MKSNLKTASRAAFALTFAVLFATSTSAQSAKDEAAVREAIQAYLDGMARGDTLLLHKAFDTTGSLDGVNRDGTMMRLPVVEWARGFHGKTFPAETHKGRIVKMDLTDYVGYAKIELNWPTVRYVDYMSLLRTSDGWKITEKIWYTEAPDASVKASLDGNAAEEDAAIREAVNAYFRSLTHYDKTAVERAFHKDAFISSSRGGRLSKSPFEQWKNFTSQSAPAHPDSMYNKIVSIDRTGNRAMVKVDLDWPDVRYVDYLALIKFGNEWRISNKVWFSEPSARAMAGVKDVAMSATELARYSGEFQIADGPLVKASVVDGRLAITLPNGDVLALLAQGNHEFALKPAPRDRMKFIVTGEAVTGFELTQRGRLIKATRK